MVSPAPTLAVFFLTFEQTLFEFSVHPPDVAPSSDPSFLLDQPEKSSTFFPPVPPSLLFNWRLDPTSAHGPPCPPFLPPVSFLTSPIYHLFHLLFSLSELFSPSAFALFIPFLVVLVVQGAPPTVLAGCSSSPVVGPPLPPFCSFSSVRSCLSPLRLFFFFLCSFLSWSL